MPLFLFISGLFHRNENIIQKSVFYFSIGFLTKILLTITPALFGAKAPTFELLSDSFIPWFMFALGGCNILAYILREQNKRFVLLAFIVLAMFTGYDQSIGDYLYLSRFTVFFPFYLLGTMMDQTQILRFKAQHRFCAIPAALILLVWGCLCFIKLDSLYIFRGLFTGRNPFYDGLPLPGPIARLFCYGITFLTGASLVLVTPNIRLPFISSAGTQTLNVFFWHYVPYYILSAPLATLFSLGRLGKISVLLCAVAITAFLSLPVFSFPLKQIKAAVYEWDSKKNQKTAV